MAGVGCAAAGGGAAAVATASCPPPVPLDEPARYGALFIDGRLVGAYLEVRRTSELPEAYELAGPEPPELAAIPVDRIDLVQYARGPDAERDHSICPGTVAILFTTRAPDRPS